METEYRHCLYIQSLPPGIDQHKTMGNDPEVQVQINKESFSPYSWSNPGFPTLCMKCYIYGIKQIIYPFTLCIYIPCILMLFRTLVVYLPNYPYSTHSNTLTFQLSYSNMQSDNIILNGYEVVTMANDNPRRKLDCLRRRHHPQPLLRAHRKHCPGHLLPGASKNSDGTVLSAPPSPLL